MGKTRTVQGQIKNESAGMQAPTMEQKGEHVLKETGLNINRTTEDKGTLPETSHGKEAPKETYKKQGIIDHAVPTEPETAQGWMDLCITEWALKDRKISLPEGADWRVIYKKRPFGRNLLKSPNPEGLSTYQPPPQEECDPPPQRRPLETLGDFSGWTIGTEEIPVDRSNVPPGVVVCYLPVYRYEKLCASSGTRSSARARVREALRELGYEKLCASSGTGSSARARVREALRELGRGREALRELGYGKLCVSSGTGKLCVSSG
uniref:FBA domain-containing protein n=1 Tax=Leptobrachium leishanense TaxID=445787 RepID=A0A8C5WGQ8_9ANUR